MNKKIYEKPDIEVVNLQKEDIITTSGINPERGSSADIDCNNWLPRDR